MRTRIYYATDTFCIWCWGLGPALREFAERNADRLWVDVVPAGMLTGDRVLPVGRKERVAESARRVGELTGVECGEAFFAAVTEGSTVLDSDVAGRAFVALRELLGAEAGLSIAHALQEAWYGRGEDLHDDEVLVRVAESVGADGSALVTAMGTEATAEAASAEYQRCRDLDVKGYPTLLVETSEGLKPCGGPTSSADRLTACFDALVAGEEPPAEPGDDLD